MLFSFLGLLLCKNGRSLRLWLKQTQGWNDKTIIELGYCKIFRLWLKQTQGWNDKTIIELGYCKIFRLWLKQTQGWNDKTIIELGYCKISWCVSGEQMNLFGWGK